MSFGSRGLDGERRALRAWAYLSRVVEPPCAELAALVQPGGPVEAAERVRRGRVDDTWPDTPEPGVKSTVLQRTSSCWRVAAVG